MSDEQLRQLLLMHEVPPFSDLSPEQRAGDACTWCSTPTDGDMAELGGSLGWQPRGCQTCYTIRFTFVRTYQEWAAHCGDCDGCALARCDRAEQLALEHQAARKTARKPAQVRCVDCKTSVHLARRRIAPKAWLGEHGLYLTYAHTGPCPVTRRHSGRTPSTRLAVARRPERHQ